MALFKTNLVIVAAQLPPDFIGTPQEFFEALVERMEIQSPVGTNFFVVGDVEPSGDVGPWLKNGDRWYVFSQTEGRYVPINIDDSLAQLFVVSATEPAAPGEDDATLWLRTSGNRGIGWYGWTGTVWRSINDVPPSGPTTSRPTSPVDLETYFDTDISVLIHWERGAWRTVSGSPGDVKAVVWGTAAIALQVNPGWSLLGVDDSSYLGRVIGIASKDLGATPETSLPVPGDITPRAVDDDDGAQAVTLDSTQIEQHTHLMGHATALNSNNNAQFHRVDNGADVSIPAPVPPNGFQVNGEGATNGTLTGSIGDGPTGTMLVTTRQLSLANAASLTAAAEPHNNMQPTKFLWHLVKD